VKDGAVGRGHAVRDFIPLGGFWLVIGRSQHSILFVIPTEDFSPSGGICGLPSAVSHQPSALSRQPRLAVSS
jgi:hypothetical protein